MIQQKCNIKELDMNDAMYIIKWAGHQFVTALLQSEILRIISNQYYKKYKYLAEGDLES